MKHTSFSLYKYSPVLETKFALHFAKHLLPLIMIVTIYPLSAQEVFDNKTTGTYSLNTQVTNLYDLTLANTDSWQKDFKNPNSTAYKLQGDASTGTVDRFGNPSQALAFNSYQNLIVPPTVTKDIVSNNKGFSVSAWIKVPENGKDCQILSFTNPSSQNREDIQLRMKDGYFQILKYSSVAQKKVVLGQARYKISYKNDNTGQEIFPGPNEYGAGYIYFMLSSNKNATRLYFSRPGGRLYANYFWFGLSDVLSANHNITFGTVNNQQGAILSALDDIMIYREMLTPELANNHFLVQSPLYPARSYELRSYRNSNVYISASSKSQIYQELPIITGTNPTPEHKIYGSSRWMLPTRKFTNGKPLITILNSQTFLPFAKDDPNSFFNQDIIGYNTEPQLYEPNHIIGNPNNLIDANQQSFTFLMDKFRAEKYQLGFSGDKLYLQYANKPDDNWYVRGSFKTSVRERFSPVSELGIRVINYGTKQSMALYQDTDQNYYLYQHPSKYESFSLIKKEPVLNNYDYRYGYEDYTFSNLAKSGRLLPNNGPAGTADNDYIKLEANGDATWQLMYVKNDPNGKPLYLIRENNGYGARILFPNFNKGGYTYITQNEITGENIPDSYLWSINVIYKGNNYAASRIMAGKTGLISNTIENQTLNVYPNPVKENTTIEYTLAQSGAVKVYISSATGALVKTVKDGSQNKGTYKESLNTSGWTSGIYLCTLQLNGQVVQTKKIIVQ